MKSFLSIHIKYITLHILEQVQIASNPQDAINQSDFVILMLPNGEIVRDVCQSNFFSVKIKLKTF